MSSRWLNSKIIKKKSADLNSPSSEISGRGRFCFCKNSIALVSTALLHLEHSVNFCRVFKELVGSKGVSNNLKVWQVICIEWQLYQCLLTARLELIETGRNIGFKFNLFMTSPGDLIKLNLFFMFHL